MKCITWLRTKIRDLLYWNGFIRLFMEMFSDVALTAALNLYTADWSHSSSQVYYSNVLAVILLATLGIVPPIILCFFKYKWARTSEINF